MQHIARPRAPTSSQATHSTGVFSASAKSCAHSSEGDTAGQAGDLGLEAAGAELIVMEAVDEGHAFSQSVGQLGKGGGVVDVEEVGHGGAVDRGLAHEGMIEHGGAADGHGLDDLVDDDDVGGVDGVLEADLIGGLAGNASEGIHEPLVLEAEAPVLAESR